MKEMNVHSKQVILCTPQAEKQSRDQEGLDHSEKRAESHTLCYGVTGGILR